MAETDNNQNSASRRKIWGGVPSINRNLSTHQVSCLLVLQLLSCVSSREERRKTWTKRENYFGYHFHVWCGFTEIFGILFS